MGRADVNDYMKIPLLTVLLLLSCFLSAQAQLDMVQAVNESDYGMVRTNLALSYDRTFGSVPDNVSARVSYQIVKKPFLTFSANVRFNTLWANFDSSQLSKPLNAWDIGLDGNHTYGSFGFTATGFLPLFGKPLALLAVGNAEWSNHCFGRISGLIGGVYLFKLSKDTQFGVGPLFMINTASKIPVFPVVVYRHRFSDRFAINVYGGLFGMEYKPDENNMLTFGADLDVHSFYFKPHVEGWPEKCRFTMTSLRPALKFKHSFFKNFYGEVQAGVSFKISGRVSGVTGKARYLEFEEKPSFFLKATVSYSL